MSDATDNPDECCGEVQRLKTTISRWIKILVVVLGLIGTTSMTILGYYHNRLEKHETAIAEVKQANAVLQTHNESVSSKQEEMHKDIREMRTIQIQILNKP